MTGTHPTPIHRTPLEGEPAHGLLRRAIRRLRRPLSPAHEIEQTAARNRVERLFEVNFRHSWTR